MSYGVQCDQCKAFTAVPMSNPGVPAHWVVLTTQGIDHQFCTKRCAAVYITNN